MRNGFKMAMVTLGLASLVGCATPRYLINDFTMGDRSVKYILTPVAAQVDAGGGKKDQLYDFSVRICDLDKQDDETNCKDTTIVQNVHKKSVY